MRFAPRSNHLVRRGRPHFTIVAVVLALTLVGAVILIPAYASLALALAFAVSSSALAWQRDRMSCWPNGAKGSSPRISLAAASVLAMLGTACITSSFDLRHPSVFSSISVAGIMTILVVAANLFVVLLTPAVAMAPGLARSWPLAAMATWEALRLVQHFNFNGVQLVVVQLGFVSQLLLSSALVRVFGPRRSMDLVNRASTAVFVLGSIGFWGLRYLNGPGAIGPRSYALFATVGAAYFLGRSESGRKMYALFALISIALVGASLSRLAFGAGLVLVVLIGIRVATPRKWIRSAVLGAAVVSAGAFSLLYYAPLHDRFVTGDVRDVGGISISLQGREVLWKAVYGSAIHNPVVGHGPGSAEDVVTEALGHYGQPHNDYLRLFEDVGLVGVTLFVLTVASLSIRARRLATRLQTMKDARTFHMAAFLSVAVLLMAMLTDNPVAYLNVMGPIATYVGMSIGLEDWQRRAASQAGFSLDWARTDKVAFGRAIRARLHNKWPRA